MKKEKGDKGEEYKPAYGDGHRKSKADRSQRDSSTQEKYSKYMSYDLLNLSEDEQRRCDRTLPEPLLKTPVLPRNLPLTSTSKKENVERREKGRSLKDRNIDRNEKWESASKRDNERKYIRRRTSGYVSFNTERDKTRSENTTSSEEENDSYDMRSRRSEVEFKYSHDKNNKPGKLLSQNGLKDKDSENEYTEPDQEHHFVHTGSHHKNSRKIYQLKPRRGRDAIKSSHFSGTANESLEAFLIQFHNCVIYNRWSTDDALAHLKSFLTGNALQLLWESPFHDFTFEELVDKLKQRFGSVGQSQKFRAELKSRRRQKGESIQSVYADVCRLLSLAYPNQFELPTTQEVGIDLFLEALEDPSLERRVREKELSTLDETFRYCLKLEAYDKAIIMRSDSRRQPVHVARNMHEKPDSTMDMVKQQLDKILLGQQQAEEKYKRLETNYEELRSSLFKQNSDLPKNNRNESKFYSSEKDTYTGDDDVSPQNPSRQFSKKNVRCYNCNRYGHIKKECRQPRRERTDELAMHDSSISNVAEGNTTQQNYNAYRVGGLFETSTEEQEVYLLAKIDGQERRCLLDSGCELSILPYEFVKNYELMPSHRRMRSANDVAIPVLGEVEVKLELVSWNI